MNIAINGFGRIGRQALRIAMDKGLNVVAINDLTRADELAHLLKYDSVYGEYPGEIKAYIGVQEFVAGAESLLDLNEDEIAKADSHFEIEGEKIHALNIKNPEELPWKDLGVDVVLECTGAFRKDDAAEAHVKAGAKQVIISAPSKGDQPAPTHVLGASDVDTATGKVISNASCTTNCISPVTKVMYEKFAVQKAAMTTIHSYTASQNLVDGLHKDLRRGRAAAQNIVPTSTGAALATTKVLPDLENLFDGIAVRVPTVAGSLSDITYVLQEKVDEQHVNEAFREAEEQPEYQGIIATSEAPLVSSDIVGRSESAIIDLPMTKVVDGDLVKVLAWYDNEWGYANRLVDIAERLA